MIERFLINKQYARLWMGQTTSLLGDAAFDTTLVLWVATVLAVQHKHTLPWAPIAVGGLATVVGASVLLVGPLSGVFVDRWNRRSTMLRTEVIRMVLVGALTAASLLPVRALPIGVWLVSIYVVVFIVNGCGQFFNQSRFAVIGDVVHGSLDRERAASIGQATNGAVAIIGPPLAAPLLIKFGLPWALLFNTLTYIVSFAMIYTAGLERRPIATAATADQPGPWHGFREGIRWFTGNKYMMRIVYGFVIGSLGAGSLNSLMVFFISTNLHMSTKLLGFVDTCFGVGAIIGALLAGKLMRLLGARRLVWLGMLAGGIFVVALARQGHMAGGLILFVAISVPTIAYNTALTPILLAHTPKEFLGRMQSILMPTLQIASITSVLVSGWLASTYLRGFHAQVLGVAIGPYDTLFTASGLLIILAAVYMMFALPRDENPDRPPTSTVEDTVEPVAEADIQPQLTVKAGDSSIAFE